MTLPQYSTGQYQRKGGKSRGGVRKGGKSRGGVGKGGKSRGGVELNLLERENVHVLKTMSYVRRSARTFVRKRSKDARSRQKL